jgi:hypothetical protein
MDLKSFVSGVLSGQVGDLATENANLLDVKKDDHSDTFFDTINSRNRHSREVGWILWDDPQDSRDVVDKLRTMFPFLPDSFPPPHAQL